MHCYSYLDDVVVWTPAKVNLFLEVIGKRPDGYHEIQTVMAALRLFDTLVFQNADEVSLTCSQPDLSTGADNLILRSARLLKESTGCPRGVRIRLTKRIPVAAGLAGGSSDAAATLFGLNRLWQLGLATEELMSLAAQIGSDVAFFFHTPAALCTGRGEIVAPTPMGQPLDLVLVCPTFGMPTAPVYKQLIVPDTPRDGLALRDALARGEVDEIGRLMFNRLQPAADAIDGRIGMFLERIRRLGPAGRLMSGSGSTLFALCRSAAEAENLGEALRADFTPDEASVQVVRTL